ncbi:alginate export family protein [Sphingomonas oligophenolica]|uniref:Alginate export family protein n=1 Tax=Sphingomonas oligophenolica TaxID=301154 RepID=A0A502CKK4_9SPHN|nr:alginate export family protein [Sphingomonas oligophenolica]TPG12296.1 alginate export family protein [Sphingomonas oligophenolica]
MTRSTLLVSLAAALLPATAHAEDGKLDISLELRARLEPIGGQFRPSPAPHNDQALLLRTALFAEYDAGPFRIGGEVVDARAYLEKRRSSAGTTEIDALEPIQAYVATDLSDVAMAKAGRFVLNLGSRRLIARNNFRNTINAFTGIQGVFGDARLGATAFWTVAQTRLPTHVDGLRDNRIELDRERGSPHLFGVFTHAKTAVGTLEAYGYRLAENDSRDILTRNRHLWTVGARLVRAPAANAWDYELEAAGQGGHARASARATDVADRPVHAGFVHATVGRTLPGAWKPRIALLADYATGERSGRSITRFDTLFGARVFEFGPTSLFGAVQRANLVSVELLGEVKPDARSDALLAIRPLFLASATDSFATTNVADPTGNAGTHAGTQIEARYRRFLVPDTLRVSVGGAYLAKGRFLRDAANAPTTGDTIYGFVELTATL